MKTKGREKSKNIERRKPQTEEDAGNHTAFEFLKADVANLGRMFSPQNQPFKARPLYGPPTRADYETKQRTTAADAAANDLRALSEPAVPESRNVAYNAYQRAPTMAAANGAQTTDATMRNAITNNSQLSQTQKEAIAYTLLGEAGGEGARGMTAVMQVIKNRSESGRYPSDPAAVALQHNRNGIYQFSAWNDLDNEGNDPKGKYSPESKEFKEAMQIVERVMAGAVPDETGGATHFVSKGKLESSPPVWWDSEAPEGNIQIGNHVFGARTVMPATMSADLKKQRALQSIPLPKPAPLEEGTPLRNNKVQTVPIDPTTGMPRKDYGQIAARTAIHDAREDAVIAAQTPTPREPTSLEDIHDRNEDRLNPPARQQSTTVVVRPDGTVTRVMSGGTIPLPPGVVPKVPTISAYPEGSSGQVRESIHDSREDALQVAQGTSILPVQPPAMRTVAVQQTVKKANPQWMSDEAINKLADLHDREEARRLRAQGIPEFLEEVITVNKQVPVAAPLVRPIVAPQPALPRPGSIARRIAEQAIIDPTGAAIGAANRRSAKKTYDISGGDNAFNPISVQNSSRWQTGY